MNWYNGYSPQERSRKLRELQRRFPGRSHPYYNGAYHICGDPDAPVMPHSEDYSEPYEWYRPAEYAVCRTCHDRIHRRFSRPFAWEACKRHLRRGGRGSDLKSAAVARMVSKPAWTLEAGGDFPMEPLRPPPPADAWWEKLTTDPASLTAPGARKP